MLDRIEIGPETTVNCAVIWLHGLGADGHDFEPLVRQWGLADALGARFILPHAPIQPVTLNGGIRMRSWYDIYALEQDGDEDAEGIERARSELLHLIEQEQQRGIPSEKILLAGFSQGGALVLHTALRTDQVFAGVLVLSGYLPLRERLDSEKRADPAHLNLRVDHGLQDPVVPYAMAKRSVEFLQRSGFAVDFHTYGMQHSLCQEQIDSLHDWFVAQLSVVL